MAEARTTIKDALRGRPRTRWIVLGWVAGLASAVLSGLLTTALQDHFADPTFEQRLDDVVHHARAGGFDVVSYRRVPLGDGREDTVVLVLRPRDRARSDRLEVYAAHGSELRRSLAWEPRPDRARALFFGNQVPVATRGRRRGYRIDVAAVGRAGPDQGSTRVLIEARGADRYLHYPLILTWDSLRRRHELSAVLTGGFPIGPGTVYTRGEHGTRVLDTTGLRLVKELYGRPTTLRDALHRVPRLKTRGANALTFIRRDGVLYLAAGFVVYADPIQGTDDVDCELQLLDDPDLPVTCPTSGPTVGGTPTELNMKAWRLDPGDGDDTVTFCAGPRLIVHTKRYDDAAALARNWRRYQRGGRSC